MGTRATGLTRVVSTAQILGSLLAVPLGLGSGYSIYRANFSPETTCQNLRGSIISMLDRSVDAATRRMLVRRDVQAFEEHCEGFDPDAHKAFKVLLAVPQVVATPAAATPAAAPQLRAALPAAEGKSGVDRNVERKAETKTGSKVEANAKADVKPEPKSETRTKTEPRAVAKRPDAALAHAAVAAPEPAPREAVVSDTRWLAAVRQALVTHDPDAARAMVAPAKPEPVKPEQAKLEVKPEPAKLEVKPAQARLEQAKPEQVKPEQAKSEQAKPEQANEQAKLEQANPAQAEPSAAGKGNAAPILLQPAWNVTPPPADTQASTSPADANAAQPPQASGDHPVPPASIPVSEQKDGDRSALGSWIAEIPFVGRVIEPRN